MDILGPHLPLIGRSPLFDGICADDLEALLSCLGARTRAFSKGAAVLRRGNVTTHMGMVLEGAVRVERDDYWGNRNIIASFGPGQSFAEVYACEPDLPLDVNVVAASDALVLFLDVGRVATMCSTSCAFHARLVRNLLGLIAKRTHALTRKIDQAESAGSNRFSIPFDRQELADYLSVDRSAMCAELSRMKRDGLVDFQRNQFEIVQRSIP